jgi:hypothetical protein
MTVRAAVVAHVRDRWPELAFAVLFALAIALDLTLEFTGRESISATVWDATAAHPTLVAAGMLLTVGVGALLRKSWPAVLVWGILCGHLFVHQ